MRAGAQGRCEGDRTTEINELGQGQRDGASDE